MKLLNFENWSSGKLSNIRLFQKLMLSKKVNTKKCASKFVFCNEKEIRKIG